jgi:protocatechuate 3,4-dioxygenase beta subunit
MNARRSSHTTPCIFAVLLLVSSAAPLPAQLGTTPNHRAGAPFRAKLSPPHAEGTVLLVKGTLTDAKSGGGVASAVLDAFQADSHGDYDTQGFDYRARILTDEAGRFEFETIVPSNYGPAPHIHFVVTAEGYRTLRTEMLFKDEEHPTTNHPELTPELVERTANGKTYLEAAFNLELIPAR